jgi:hypothetical protein
MYEKRSTGYGSINFNRRNKARESLVESRFYVQVYLDLAILEF